MSQAAPTKRASHTQVPDVALQAPAPEQSARVRQANWAHARMAGGAGPSAAAHACAVVPARRER